MPPGGTAGMGERSSEPAGERQVDARRSLQGIRACLETPPRYRRTSKRSRTRVSSASALQVGTAQS